MGKKFAYRGDEAMGRAIDLLAQAAGWERVGDVASALIVLTYCTSQTVLEDVYFEDGGLVQSASKGTMLVDLSPSTPGFARELSAVATVNDLAVVEAPLAVVDPARPDALSERENLLCFVAGEEDSVNAARPLLEALAGAVREMGVAGSAQLARAARTLQTTAQIIAAVEADALCRSLRCGSAVFGALDVRPEATDELSGWILGAVAEGRFEGPYTVEMLMAELSAALMAADDADLILPQAEACQHLLELLAVIGGAGKAPAALSLVYGDEAACADNGLDWTRAEQAYGERVDAEGDDDALEYDECGYEGCDDGYDDCGCGHGHGRGSSRGGFSGYPGYSEN